MKMLETLNVAMTPRQPLGMTPSGVALSADQTRLFVACSDANVVAVADISEERSRVEGFIPSGWYPTAARVAAGRTVDDAERPRTRELSRAGCPVLASAAADTQGDLGQDYVANMQTGTLSVIDPLTDEALDGYTKTALSLSALPRQRNWTPDSCPATA